MAFYGNSFIFDGVSSETYGLKITTPNSNEKTTIIQLKSDLKKTHRQSKFVPSRQYVDEPRVLPISLYSETPLTRSQIDGIEQWLFRRDGKFKKLIINQDDMKNYYYNCRLNKLDEETYGNVPYLIHVEMQCDSIFAWENPQTIVYQISSLPYVINFNNISSENNMKPIYKIKCNSSNGNIKITDNYYDDVRQSTMEFNTLLNGEVLTIDTEHCIITSNLRTNGLLDLFKYINYMRLDKGLHTLTITGNISEFGMTYQNCRVIGG